MRNWFFTRSKSLVCGLAASTCLLGQSGCVSNHEIKEANSVTIDMTDSHLLFSGRMADQGILAWSGARVRLRFSGTSVAVRMKDETKQNAIQVFLDGAPTKKVRLDSSDGLYLLADKLESGPHTIEIVRATEANQGLVEFKGFELGEGGEALPWGAVTDRKIEFIGDSITCGYGVEAASENEGFTPDTENFCFGYSGLTVRNLDADYLVVSRSGIGMVRDYDGPYEGSEETMPSIYPYSIYHDTTQNWDFQNYVPDVVCINLGTNDFSTTGVNVDKYISHYVAFANQLANSYPQAKLVMIQGPMENGDALKQALHSILEQVNAQHPDTAHYLELSPQGSLGYGADYHPNKAQSQVNAKELTAYLAGLMNWN